LQARKHNLNKEHVHYRKRIKKLLIYSNESILHREIWQNRFSYFPQFLCKPTDNNRWLNFISTFRQIEDNGYPFFRQIFPATRVAVLWRVLWLSDRYAVKIYRGKLKCHRIIARSEAIEIPDSKPRTIEPCDRTRLRLLRVVLCSQI